MPLQREQRIGILRNVLSQVNISVIPVAMLTIENFGAARNAARPFDRQLSKHCFAPYNLRHAWIDRIKGSQKRHNKIARYALVDCRRIVQNEDALDRIVWPRETTVRQLERLHSEIRTMTTKRDAKRVGLQAKTLSKAIGSKSDFHDDLLIPIGRRTVGRDRTDSIEIQETGVTRRDFGTIDGTMGR